ncbi:hypothetical protein HBH75_104340 [Parastagonospora nodorum]|nr:hypothetical protein HBH75_104340 [Parastagonospora nodorum]KAH5017890.1 hypothetical protein HBI74_161430 [Parastagonospora nodorum]KAH5997705.1 hypothetical protein HBI84_121200 [Parastagonospora nodorum]KAH6046759.1 hypothetical protein HBI54_087090 [Parastagonospora nodorum]KAH6412989.1 hypothetical protein HBI14_133950 [Parastagonospora nodorum]
MAAEIHQSPIQILTYIRRNRSLTGAQFYTHWEMIHAPKVIPWAEKHGIIRYQQIHTTGSMVPIPSTASAPNALHTIELPTTPVEFDGIAMFLVPSLEQFTVAFQDRYYVEVIEPDERVLLDKEGPGSGIVASFVGREVRLVEVEGMSGGVFGEFERKAAAAEEDDDDDGN